MHGDAGGLDGDVAVGPGRGLYSLPTLMVRFFFPPFSLHGNKQPLTLVTQRRLRSNMACLPAVVFSGLKLCGLVLIPRNAWT